MFIICPLCGKLILAGLAPLHSFACFSKLLAQFHGLLPPAGSWTPECSRPSSTATPIWKDSSRSSSSPGNWADDPELDLSAFLSFFEELEKRRP
jgi:hypothetical protein